MLTGIMVDVIQPIHEVRHVIDRRLLLAAGSPEQQGWHCSLPNTMLAGGVPVVSS
jgi:hypothetical protein